jgi:hypothetical protein
VYAVRATIFDFGAFCSPFSFSPAIFSAPTAKRAKIRDFLRTFARRFWGDDAPDDRLAGWLAGWLNEKEVIL